MDFLSKILGLILKFIYETVSQIGSEPKQISYFAITIIIMTLIYKLALLPVTLSNIKMQKVNAKLQPEMKKLEKKYKHDPQLYQQKVMELQKEMGFSPFASCLPMIVQLVIVWALLAVMRKPMEYMGVEGIRTNFFWIKDLMGPDPTKLVLPLMLSGSQILMSLLMQPKKKKNNDGSQDPTQSMNFAMTWVMPIMFFFMFRNYQAALALYWTVGNIVELVIRLFLNNSKKEDELAEEQIEKKKEELEKKNAGNKKSGNKKSGNKKKGA